MFLRFWVPNKGWNRQHCLHVLYKNTPYPPISHRLYGMSLLHDTFCRQRPDHSLSHRLRQASLRLQNPELVLLSCRLVFLVHWEVWKHCALLHICWNRLHCWSELHMCGSYWVLSLKTSWRYHLPRDVLYHQI